MKRDYSGELQKLQEADQLLSRNIVVAKNRLNMLIDEQEQIRDLIRGLGKVILEKGAK
jgi:hypothetical protein